MLINLSRCDCMILLGHPAPEQFAGPDGCRTYFYLLIASCCQKFLVINTLSQPGMIFQHTKMTEYLRQLVIRKSRQLIEVSKCSPTLAPKCPMEISNTYLRSFKETHLVVSVGSNIVKRGEV